MKTVIKQEGNHYLIMNSEDRLTPFVVCADFNGNDWYWGHYFSTIDDALSYFNSEYCEG